MPGCSSKNMIMPLISFLPEKNSNTPTTISLELFESLVNDIVCAMQQKLLKL